MVVLGRVGAVLDQGCLPVRRQGRGEVRPLDDGLTAGVALAEDRAGG